MGEELLIKLVGERRELYDVEHKLYEDTRRRKTAWHEISKRTMLPAQECRDRWKRLRDNYRRARKLRVIKKRQGATKIKPIKHEEVMSFLDSILENGNELPDIMDDTEAGSSFLDDTDAGSSVIFHEKKKGVSDVSLDFDPLMVQERPYLGEATSNKSDTVVAFFTNLGETVTTFPEALQIKVKRDIFRIINDAEEEVLRMNRKEAKLTKCVISDCQVISYVGNEK